MTRKLRVYQEAPEPRHVDGVPVCAAACKHYEFVRPGGLCTLHGQEDDPLGTPCIPAIREMAAEVEELRVELKDAAAELAQVLAVDCESETEWLEAMEVTLESHGKKCGENFARVIKQQLRYLQLECARKVEPLSDEERCKLWEFTREYGGEHEARDVYAILDRLQGKQGSE